MHGASRSRAVTQLVPGGRQRRVTVSTDRRPSAICKSMTTSTSTWTRPRPAGEWRYFLRTEIWLAGRRRVGLKHEPMDGVELLQLCSAVPCCAVPYGRTDGRTAIRRLPDFRYSWFRAFDTEDVDSIGLVDAWRCSLRVSLVISSHSFCPKTWQVYQLTPMDRATLSHVQSTIALFTELDAECDQQATVVRRCWKHLATSDDVARCSVVCADEYTPRGLRRNIVHFGAVQIVVCYGHSREDPPPTRPTRPISAWLVSDILARMMSRGCYRDATRKTGPVEFQFIGRQC